MNHPRKRSELTIDNEVEGTFPASDPPSYMGSTAIAGAPNEHRSSTRDDGEPVRKEHADVDLNGASEEELGAMPALGPDHIRTILAHRPFTSWEDLKPLPGFDGGTIAALKKGGGHIGR